MTDITVIEPTEKEAAIAFGQQQVIKTLVHEMRVHWLKLAESLYVFAEAKGWASLGYKSFEQWLADPDIEINRRNAFYLIESWRELVVKRGVNPSELEGLDVSKVREVMPAIRRDKVTLEDGLADARVLGRDDLRERYQNIGVAGDDQGGPHTHRLEATDEPAWMKCEACGSTYRVKGAPSRG